jgi:bacteriocin-like protein
MTNALKSSRRDHQTTTTDDANIELTEQELSRITGGRGKTSEKPREFIKITMSDIIVSHY